MAAELARVDARIPTRESRNEAMRRAMTALGLLACAMGACSRTTNDEARGDGGANVPACGPRLLDEFDSGRDCFASAPDVAGLCTTAPSGERTTGIETVCVANAQGRVFLLDTATDVAIDGSGWTVGSRAAPGLVPAAPALSPALQSECTRALRAAAGGLGPRKRCDSLDGGDLADAGVVTVCTVGWQIVDAAHACLGASSEIPALCMTAPATHKGVYALCAFSPTHAPYFRQVTQPVHANAPGWTFAPGATANVLGLPVASAADEAVCAQVGSIPPPMCN